MEDLNIVRTGMSISQKSISFRNKEQIDVFIDPKGYFGERELQALGYVMKGLNIKDIDDFNSYNYYRALEQLKKDDPIKHNEITGNLEILFKNDE